MVRPKGEVVPLLLGSGPIVGDKLRAHNLLCPGQGADHVIDNIWLPGVFILPVIAEEDHVLGDGDLVILVELSSVLLLQSSALHFISTQLASI